MLVCVSGSVRVLSLANTIQLDFWILPHLPTPSFPTSPQPSQEGWFHVSLPWAGEPLEGALRSAEPSTL